MIDILHELKSIAALASRILQEEATMVYYHDKHVSIFSAGSLYGYDKIPQNPRVRVIMHDIIQAEREFSFYHKEITPLFVACASQIAYQIEHAQYTQLNPITPIQEKQINDILKEIEKKLSFAVIPVDVDTAIQKAIDFTTLDYTASTTIRKLIERIGSDGFYALEYSLLDNENDIVVPVEGYTFYLPSIRPEFIEDVVSHKTVLDTPYIILYEGSFERIDILYKLITIYVNEYKPIVIIANQFGDLVINSCIRLLSSEQARIYPISLHLRGQQGREVMEDIAFITGATVLRPEYMEELEKALGTCEQVTIHKHNVTLIPQDTYYQKRLQRAEILRYMAEQEKDFERKVFLHERAAKLTSKVAIVSIGGKHRINREYRRDRFVRAVSYTQNAIKKGIIRCPHIVKTLSSIHADALSKIVITTLVEHITCKKHSIDYPYYSIVQLMYYLLHLASRWCDLAVFPISHNPSP